jgi:hypothetical protein
MNLENLNLVELNAQEIQETEGGFIPLIILNYFIRRKSSLALHVCNFR